RKETFVCQDACPLTEINPIPVKLCYLFHREATALRVLERAHAVAEAHAELRNSLLIDDARQRRVVAAVDLTFLDASHSALVIAIPGHLVTRLQFLLPPRRALLSGALVDDLHEDVSDLVDHVRPHDAAHHGTDGL